MSALMMTWQKEEQSQLEKLLKLPKLSRNRRRELRGTYQLDTADLDQRKW